MSEINALIALVTTGGFPLLVVVLVIGGYRKWYIWSWVSDALLKDKDSQINLLTKDRDDWKELALRGTSDAKLLIEWALKTSNESKK